ncbi:DUF1031 family protein [Lactococcus lactis]|uniref:Uncharacterized protein n=1 Tax=Lactococcus lactis TaxID=1358 RepID=A0AAW5TQ08_9LACT|nr:DUF1031 family protein [Lactococcus lactis]MCW2281390.1 hypothetical protein [Lactococcus lactis]MCW2281467.1 hypothetical protein [Lactococcus lactis]
MVAIEVIPANKLLTLARKKAIYKGEGQEQVFISKRTKLNEAMEQTYQKLCIGFNENKPMKWNELYHLLKGILYHRKIYTKNTENKSYAKRKI